MPLPILNESYRPSSNWLQEIVLKREQLEKLSPFNADLLRNIEAHLLVEQVTANLQLGDIAITAERVRELIDGATPTNQAEQAARGFADAARHLNKLLSQHQVKAEFNLTSELLRELHALTMSELGGGGHYRTETGRSLAAGHEPADPEILPIFIDNALGWFSAESFRELHPLEQAWLVHLRLIELQPFAQANGRVARLVTSLYAQRVDLAPIIINAEQRDLYNIALANSFQMITQPGVELLAQSVVRTLDEMIKLAETDLSKQV